MWIGRVSLLTMALVAAFGGHVSLQTLREMPASRVVRSVFETAAGRAATRDAPSAGTVLLVQFDQLAQAAAQGGVIDIPLTRDLTVRMRVARTQTTTTQTFVVGPLIEGHDGEAGLTAVGDTLAGRVVSYGRLFVIRRLDGSALHIVTEIDPASLPAERPDTVDEPTPGALPPAADGGYRHHRHRAPPAVDGEWA